MRLALLLLLASGCYDAHQRPVDAGPIPDSATCDPALRPHCVRRDSPCDALQLVDPACVVTTWQCQGDASIYAPPWNEDRCLPLRDQPLYADGVHESPVPVPIGDHCEWIFPYQDGSSIQLLGVASGSTCASLGAVVEPIDAPHDASSYVNVEAAIVTPTSTRLLSRAWAFDPMDVFGVHSLGVELGRVEAGALAFDGAFVFAGETDLGDAAIVVDGFAYAYGHPATSSGLEADMVVGRAPVDAIDDESAWQIFGAGGWGAGAPVAVFGSGPHRSAVVRDPRGSGYLHLYAAGFGTDLRLNTAPAPEGPWTPAITLAPCELPADDPGAYCAGPQIHRELLDPLTPNVLVVSYSIGSTSADQADRRMRNPDAYWPRVVRVPLN